MNRCLCAGVYSVCLKRRLVVRYYWNFRPGTEAMEIQSVTRSDSLEKHSGSRGTNTGEYEQSQPFVNYL